MDATPQPNAEPNAFPYKMKDLSELTGLGRQAIHFYIQRGLLPPGKKTGRNMAWYGEIHVERILLIKRLQHERFLPLKAIKAILDDQQSAFSETQRGFLLGVKQHLVTRLDDKPGETVELSSLLERLDIAAEDIDRMVKLELIGERRDPEGRRLIAVDDVWLVEAWSELHALGIARELEIVPDDLLIYDEVVTQLFQRETQLLASRLPAIPEEEAAEVIEKILPLVHGILTGMHRSKIRHFLASLG